MTDEPDPAPIRRVLIYTIPVGDYVLNMETVTETDRVDVYLTWKDKDNVKHHSTVDKRQFVSMLKELST
jgi:hypothetical protein